MSTLSNQPSNSPQPIIPASFTMPQQLPDLPAYQDATPVPPPTAKPILPKLNCGKYLVIILVVIVVLAVLAAVFLSGIPNTPRNTVSNPVSMPVSSVVSTPVEPVKPKITDIAFAGIGKDGTIRIYDPQDRDLTINLKNRHWSDIQLSPDANFLSVLSSEESNDNNLNIYNVNTGVWDQKTVFDKNTTGITGYYWIDENTIIFSQGGWLNTYNNTSGEVVKLVKVDQDLVDINRKNQQLLLRSTVDLTAKPAVTKQIPDPKSKLGDKAPLITVEVQPAIIKHDQLFTVVNFRGEKAYSARIDDIVQFSGNYILHNLYFTPITGVYLAELVGFNPDTGATTREMLKLYMLSGDLKQEVKMTTTSKVNIFGLYQADNFLFGIFDNNFALTSIGDIDFQLNQIINGKYPTPLNPSQIVDRIQIIQGYHTNDWMLQVETTEQVKGLPVKQIGWWKINQGLLQLEKVRLGVDFVELVNFTKR